MHLQKEALAEQKEKEEQRKEQVELEMKEEKRREVEDKKAVSANQQLFNQWVKEDDLKGGGHSSSFPRPGH